VTQTTYGFGSDRQRQTQFSTKSQDANGKMVEQFVNIRGLTTAHKNYTSNGDIWTSFTYDAINQLLSMTDDIGATSSSQYDMLGRCMVRIHPDAGTNQYTYDLAGNLTRMVTASLGQNKAAITYAYDFNRVTDISYPQNPENNVHYTYGVAGAAFNRAGKVVVQEDASGAQEFFYGSLGEMVKDVRTIVIPRFGQQTFVTQWNYDTWNRLTSMIYPDSEVVSYAYNVGGTLLSMTGNRGGLITNYVQQLGYDKFESRVFLVYANGTQTSYTYESDRRRLQNMQVTMSNGNGRRIMDNTYAYDKVDNILSLTNNAPVPSSNLMGGSATYIYGYDDLYRLTTAAGSFKGPKEQDRYSLTMEYNTVGSVMRKTQTNDKSPNGNKWIPQKKATYDNSYTYDAKQPHAATHIGRQTYTYDADGNQTGWTDDKTGQRQKMAWDEENRLRSVSVNGQLNSYIYDANGERVLKGSGAGQAVYVNGDISGSSGGVGNFTVYVNPYLVVKSGEYSNHYFIESQRVATRLEHGWDHQVSAPDAGNSIAYSNKEKQLLTGIARDGQALQGNDSAASVVTGSDARSQAAAGANVSSGSGTPWANANPGNNGNHYAYGHYKKSGGSTGSGGDNFLYFYHPDHLGNTSYVTDAGGEVYQHLEYFAFGETFVDEHSNTDAIPYLFNGKELDEETGLYYFGVRYYDPRTSIWQSVDPLGDVMPGWSPYRGFNDNPVKYTDPRGAKEYESAEAFERANKGKTWAKDRGKGDWLRSDRENNSGVWQNANKYNMQQADGYKEYTTIEQRTGFYGWYSAEEDLRGSTTNWAGAAYIVAKQMTLIDVFYHSGDLVMMFGAKDAKDIDDFANAGNKAIFEDVFAALRDNMNGKPKTGKAASDWDAQRLHREQFDVVQPVYLNAARTNPNTIKHLQQFAAQGGVSTLIGMPVPGFQGNIMNPQDRYNHGMNKIVPFMQKMRAISRP
jgi:RHS repeat-associated protein